MRSRASRFWKLVAWSCVVMVVVGTFADVEVLSEGLTTPTPTRAGPGSGSINTTLLSTMYAKVMKNYDKKFRPDFGVKATEVQLEVHVLSFGGIDEGQMEYGMDFYFAQFWQDNRFQIHTPHRDAIINLIGNEVENLWLPDTVFINSKDSKFHSVTINNRFLTVNFSSGNVIYHARITTKASCRMNLRYYPFDDQTCYLAIESYGHDSTDIQYKWYNFDICGYPCRQIFVYDKEMSNFDVVEAVKTQNKTAYHAETFSSATARFTFRRRTHYFILQVYFPCILLVMVTWSSFWITPTAVPARSAICVTTILTLITMLGIVNVNMPKVSYIKALDLYLFVSFIFVALSLLEYILVLNATGIKLAWLKKRRKKLNRSGVESESMKVYIEQSNGSAFMNSPLGHNQFKFNRDVSLVQPFLPEETRNGFSKPSARKRHCNNPLDAQMDYACPKSEKRKNCHFVSAVERQQNENNNDSVEISIKPGSHDEKKNYKSKVDDVSRFLFPIAYGCFNAAYWMAYFKNRPDYPTMMQ